MMKNDNKTLTQSQAMTIIIIFGLLIWAAVSSLRGSLQDSPPVTSVSTETAQFILVDNAKEAVRARLKDPTSATFRDVRYHNSATVGHAVCGEVNAKNSFGGFMGYTRFVSNGTSDVTFLESETVDFKTVWQEICIK